MRVYRDRNAEIASAAARPLLDVARRGLAEMLRQRLDAAIENDTQLRVLGPPGLDRAFGE